MIRNDCSIGLDSSYVEHNSSITRGKGTRNCVVLRRYISLHTFFSFLAMFSLALRLPMAASVSISAGCCPALRPNFGYLFPSALRLSTLVDRMSTYDGKPNERLPIPRILVRCHIVIIGVPLLNTS